MQILQTLWKLIQTYLRYRKTMKAIRTGKGAARSEDAMMTAYRKGDYQGAALCAVDPFFHGYLFMQMGQFGAAHPPLEHAVRSANDPRLRAIANNVLGQLYLEEQKLDQAEQCFTTAQESWPERGAADRCMAELLLRRGGDSAEALRLARRGLAKELAFPPMSTEARNSSLCEQIGIAAWAVAVESQDAAEVDRLEAEAARYSDGNPASTMGEMHLHFGHAYAALGNTAESVRHYEEAVRIDPNGLAGRAASSMLVPARS
jgi:tetratricopeptide (TPR) repeat protein